MFKLTFKLGTIVHVKGFGDGLKYLPEARIKLLGNGIWEYFDETTTASMQRCINLAFVGIHKHPYAFSYQNATYKKTCVGRVTYLNNDTALVVFDFSDS